MISFMIIGGITSSRLKSKKFSIDDETVIDKSIGLYEGREPDGYGFYNDILYLDVIISFKTDKEITWYNGDTYVKKFMNHQLTERYGLYWDYGTRENFLILIKKNITYPHGGYTKNLEVSDSGSYNNDYIILEKK